MLSLLLLIVLAAAGGNKGPSDHTNHAPGQDHNLPEVQTVCANNHCVGTKTNPIERGVRWISMGVLSQTGCCAFWKGPCEQCVQPYSCLHYGDGQDDAWCKSESEKKGSPVVWTNYSPDRPSLYIGCGWCACCRRTDPKTGLPANHYGAAPGTLAAIKGAVSDVEGMGLSAGMGLSETDVGQDWDGILEGLNEVSAAFPGDEADVGADESDMELLNGVFDTLRNSKDLDGAWVVEADDSLSTFDYGVYGFAVVGFGVVAYGAYKHFNNKEEDMTML